MAKNDNENRSHDLGNGLRVASDKIQRDAIALCEGFYSLARDMSIDAEVAAITMMVAAFMISECGDDKAKEMRFCANFIAGVVGTARSRRAIEKRTVN